MKDYLELHVVTAGKPSQTDLELLLVGEEFHPHKWLRGYPPSYVCIPRFGGDYVQFRGDPYQTPEEYSPIVAGLGSVILETPLKLLTIEQDRLKPVIMAEFYENPFQTFGPRLVDRIAEAIGEATDKIVAVQGDPHAFEVLDFNRSVSDGEPFVLAEELKDHPFFNP